MVYRNNLSLCSRYLLKKNRVCHDLFSEIERRYRNMSMNHDDET